MLSRFLLQERFCFRNDSVSIKFTLSFMESQRFLLYNAEALRFQYLAVSRAFSEEPALITISIDIRQIIE